MDTRTGCVHVLSAMQRESNGSVCAPRVYMKSALMRERTEKNGLKSYLLRISRRKYLSRAGGFIVGVSISSDFKCSLFLIALIIPFATLRVVIDAGYICGIGLSSVHR